MRRNGGIYREFGADMAISMRHISAILALIGRCFFGAIMAITLRLFGALKSLLWRFSALNSALIDREIGSKKSRPKCGDLALASRLKCANEAFNGR